MTAAILFVFLAFIAVMSNAQCLPGKYCSNVAAIAGRYATAQDCIRACPQGTWISYASGSGWCGCAASCPTQVANPGYQTYCPRSPSPSFRPTAAPTASPTATPTMSPTSLNKCYPGEYCSYNMAVYPSQVADASQCGALCAGQGYFTYVPSTKWCACAPAGGCNSRVPNPYADSYCL